MVDGLRENWPPGSRAWFEYHCLESPESQDANLWHRSHEQVIILGRGEDENMNAPQAERLEEGCPNVYIVQFADGDTGGAFEDELLISPRWFERPAPPARRTGG